MLIYYHFLIPFAASAWQYPLLAVQNTFLVYKSSDYPESKYYEPLISRLKPYGQVLLSDEEMEPDFGVDLGTLNIIAVGSSSLAAQQEQYSLYRNIGLVTAKRFLSLGFPIHFPLYEAGIDVAAIAPLLDKTSRSLFTFAVENYHHLRNNATVNSVLVSNTSFADFFSESLLLDKVMEVLNGQRFKFDEQHPVNLISGILQRESHQGLLPPCSFYSDADPWHVSESIECKVGNRFMSSIQLQIAIGHVAKYFYDNVIDCRDLKSQRNEGLVYIGLVEGLDQNVTVIEKEEHHYAWVHFPLHVPFVVNDTNLAKISSVSEVIYEESFYGKKPFHPALLQNKHGRLTPIMLRNVWPLSPLSPNEMRGKLASRQNVMRSLNHPNTDYDSLENKVGLPFVVGEPVIQYFEYLPKQQYQQLWQYYEQQNNKLGFCARLNLIAIRDAFQSLRFKGVRFVRTIVQQQDIVYVEPLLQSSYSDEVQLEEVHKRISSTFKVSVGLDIPTFAKTGPLWIWRPIKITNLAKDGVSYRVFQSPVLATSTEFKIKAAAGLHFCKILPPSRVVEALLYD